jgi:hypothetical protein
MPVGRPVTESVREYPAARAQPDGFYGGRVSDDVIGPFRGGPGDDGPGPPVRTGNRSIAARIAHLLTVPGDLHHTVTARRATLQKQRTFVTLHVPDL